MTNEIRTTLQFINQPGTLSSPSGVNVQVHFDFIEMQDVIDGVPGRKFSYGNLRFRDSLAPSVVPLFLSRSRLVLTGGGHQFPVLLYSLNSFTLTGPVREIRVINEPVAPARGVSPLPAFATPLEVEALAQA
jgi:hypothetical protein